AAEMLLLLRGALLDVGRGIGEVVRKLAEGQARLLLLPDIAERHAELQEAVGTLAALRVFPIALGEGSGGVIVVLAHVEGLAEPILGIARERIVGIALDESAERLL